MPKTKKAVKEEKETKRASAPRVHKMKPLVCGHEGVVHPATCRVCTKKVACGFNWLRCGGHGEHIEVDCQKLCT